MIQGAPPLSRRLRNVHRLPGRTAIRFITPQSVPRHRPRGFPLAVTPGVVIAEHGVISGIRRRGIGAVDVSRIGLHKPTRSGKARIGEREPVPETVHRPVRTGLGNIQRRTQQQGKTKRKHKTTKHLNSKTPGQWPGTQTHRPGTHQFDRLRPAGAPVAPPAACLRA